MKNIYVMTNYAGMGQRIGAFTSSKKLINYLKWWTNSSRLVFTNDSVFNDQTKWIGLGYFNAKKHFNSNVGFIKCIRDNSDDQEQDIFQILIVPANPEIEED
tara:strand:- start:154 stop:459 length:306 start_codon:yes stop_codon:yes gene_type:complete